MAQFYYDLTSVTRTEHIDPKSVREYYVTMSIPRQFAYNTSLGPYPKSDCKRLCNSADAIYHFAAYFGSTIRLDDELYINGRLQNRDEMMLGGARPARTILR